MPSTTTINQIIPEVIADLVETNLGHRLTLAPIATIDNTLVGQPGDTLKFPCFQYIGQADIIAEDGEIVPVVLTSATVSAKVKKFAKAVTITDEVRLSGYGDPIGEAARQVAYSIDHAQDKDLFSALKSVGYGRHYPAAALSAAAVANALTLYGEELEGPKVIITNPEGFAALRNDANYIRASDLGQRMICSGVVGEIWGCQILISKNIAQDNDKKEFNYYIVKPGALRLVVKAGTIVEVQREAKFARDSIFATKHCTAYLYDHSRVVAITKFTALQQLPQDCGITIAEADASNIYLQIPDHLAAPALYKWVYIIDDSGADKGTFGTALTGSTNWPGSTVKVPHNSNLYAHLILVNAADNKPVKTITLEI